MPDPDASAIVRDALQLHGDVRTYTRYEVLHRALADANRRANAWLDITRLHRYQEERGAGAVRRAP